MLLEFTHNKLGWPSRDDVLNPPGSGPSVYAQLVQSKLGSALSQRSNIGNARIGILAADPKADATEPPLAVVCEFDRMVSDADIAEAHRLAWNLCRTPLLITLEPNMIRSWTCCERPRLSPEEALLGTEIESLRIDPRRTVDFSDAATRSLSWVSLSSGQVFRDHEPRFERQTCADESLLQNLKTVRARLTATGLSTDITHDLLARLIFVQFLFHRKDEKGQAALTPEWLRRQHDEQGLFSQAHSNLESILRNRDDTYTLFKLLNERFNGDLFPGKASSRRKREAEWREEMAQVRSEHLDLLADFVGGQPITGSGQRSLWPLYAFDVIPLEFISSIYEAFVSKDKGTHYTPAYLVDVVLDTCLPWNDDNWDVKVLDPACGSGIFLVKAFQRLVYRWRRAHKFRKRPDTRVLRKLLEENLFGVDVKREAVRVACFSLYLAMCDELEPKHVWSRVRFPQLRERRLVAKDFFHEDTKGFGTFFDREHYDIVVGNAPWGTGTAKESPLAKKWGKKYKWEVSYESIGPLFLAKGAMLTKPDGRVSMLQSSSLLFNTIGTAAKFRQKMLEEFKVEQVINLSALRFGLFAEAVGPACVISLQPVPPDQTPITYVSPKPSQTADDSFRIVFDAYDYHAIDCRDAIADHGLWTTLMWGGPRDCDLVRRLARYPNLEQLVKKRQVFARQGLVRGNKPLHQNPAIVGVPLLDATDFPPEAFPYLVQRQLPLNTNPESHRPVAVDDPAYQPVQLLIKSGWKRDSGRFQARIIQPAHGPTLCSKSYVSVHFPDASKKQLEAACVTYNSKLAAYYLLHSSSRFASFIQEANVGELLRVPLPNSNVDLREVKSPADADTQVRQAFNFKPAEWVLIEDAFKYTMQAFKTAKVDDEVGPAVALNDRADGEMLKEYGAMFGRVLRAGFGQEKRIRTTVYEVADNAARSPVHLVAVHLGWPGTDDGVCFEKVQTPDLLGRLVALAHQVERRSSNGRTIRRRVFHVYDTVRCGDVRVPSVFLSKPNLARYWTRSMAMRDADIVSADLLRLAVTRQRSRRETVA